MLDLQTARKKARELKLLLKEEIVSKHRLTNHPDNIALLFSGGMDSLSCLFTLIEAGIKPTLYIFYLQDKPSADYIASQAIAGNLKLKLHETVISHDIALLRKDIEYIARRFKISRKTNVQCIHPFLHLFPEIDETFIVTGLEADTLYGTPRSAVIKYSDDSKRHDFTQARKKLLANPYTSGYKLFMDLASDYNKKLIVPYRSKAITEFFLQFSWSDLNKPRQKRLTAFAFEEQFMDSKGKPASLWRKNLNLQVGSGLRELHDLLLNTDMNRLNRDRIDSLYRDVLAVEIDKKQNGYYGYE